MERLPCPKCSEPMMPDHTVCFSARCMAARSEDHAPAKPGERVTSEGTRLTYQGAMDGARVLLEAVERLQLERGQLRGLLLDLEEQGDDPEGVRIARAELEESRRVHDGVCAAHDYLSDLAELLRGELPASHPAGLLRDIPV